MQDPDPAHNLRSHVFRCRQYVSHPFVWANTAKVFAHAGMLFLR